MGQGSSTKNIPIGFSKNETLQTPSTKLEQSRKLLSNSTQEKPERKLVFKQLDSTKRINLCSKGLDSISSNIGFLYDTNSFQMCCNSLRQIPVEIGYMQKLEILNISMNQLEFLPDEIGHLQHLKELDLSRNKLKRIPRSIGLLKNLRFLFLQSNLLQEIPSEIGLLRKLETLDLTENSLKMIPEELNRSEKLKNLFVRDLPFDLSFIPVFTNQIPSLKELCARVIVRKDIKENYTSCFIEEYLQEAKVCTFCGGPFFETCQQRVRYLVRNSITIPFESKLCMDHWRTDSERIKLMFCPLPFTAPIANRILIPKRPSLVSRMRRPLNKKANNNIRKSPSLPTLTDTSIYRPKDRLLRQISMSSLRLKSPSSLFP